MAPRALWEFLSPGYLTGSGNPSLPQTPQPKGLVKGTSTWKHYRHSRPLTGLSPRARESSAVSSLQGQLQTSRGIAAAPAPPFYSTQSVLPGFRVLDAKRGGRFFHCTPRPGRLHNSDFQWLARPHPTPHYEVYMNSPVWDAPILGLVKVCSLRSKVTA